MAIKHPNLRLALCGLLATSLLSACGGGSSSSSSGGAGSGGSYDLGYAQGTAATLDLVLDDLQALQASLAGGGAPVQTSLGRVNLSNLNLEPRQRTDLADELGMFIARLRKAQEAAAAPGAGQAAAAAAQAAAENALQALRLVVAADTAARASGGEAAQDAAIAALRQIADVEQGAESERTDIDAALNTALDTARTEVARLAKAVADAQAQLARQQGGNADVISGLTERITRLQASLTAAQDSLRALDAEFGAPPTTAALTPAALPAASVTYRPRRTGVRLFFASGFDPTSTDWTVATLYTVAPSGFGTPVTSAYLNPDPVVYDSSSRRVFTASSPNQSLFPARGTVYRNKLRRVISDDRDDTDAGTDTDIMASDRNTWVYRDEHRLIRMNHDPDPQFPATGASNSGWNNWDAEPRTTFQYRPSDGLTMGFGGEGVIFGDLERYVAKGLKNCGTNGDEYCDESVTTNVAIAFGSPTADPFRQPHTNFWTVEVSSPRLPKVDTAVDAATAHTPDLGQAGGQIEGLRGGRYELVLSNYAGIDDKDTESTADDAVRRRLSYAAYGLFQFTDFLTHHPAVGRMQTFHYGVDAFSADRAAITGRANTIEGTFRGTTLAWIVTGADKTKRNGNINNLYRTRGDIELRACIGGANCAFGDGAADDLTTAQITGTITNLEYAHDNRSDNTYWTQGGLVGPDFRNWTVTLQTDTIADDGTYSGNVHGNRDTRTGGYEGAFYGPVGAGLETAGTWWVGAPDWADNWDGIIGSFGAVCTDGCAPAAP